MAPKARPVIVWKYDLWNKSVFEVGFDRANRVVRAGTVAPYVTFGR